MKQVDMSDKAVTARLESMSQLRRLCLSLQKAKFPGKKDNVQTSNQQSESGRSETQKAK